MTSSKLFNHHGPIRFQPVFSKRTASARAQPINRRKHQVKLGQIVWYERFRTRQIVPMVVYYIDDCSLWSKSFKVEGTTTNRKDFMIYYDLQPLIKRNGKWKKKNFISLNTKDAMKYNFKLWDSGFIGHGVDMTEFALTYAEAKWKRMYQ